MRVAALLTSKKYVWSHQPQTLSEKLSTVTKRCRIFKETDFVSKKLFMRSFRLVFSGFLTKNTKQITPFYKGKNSISIKS